MKEVHNKKIENQKNTSTKSEWGDSIEGHMVATLKEGILLGNITNLYFNLTDKKVLAIEIKKLMWSDKYVVLAKDISSIGKDIIFINEKRSAKKISNINPDKHRSLHQLRGTMVTTTNGKHLGELQDIDINTRTFEITSISLGTKQSLPVNASEITVGEDEIIVPSEYEFNIIKSEKNDENNRVHFGKSLISNISKNLHLNRSKGSNEKEHERSH